MGKRKWSNDKIDSELYERNIERITDVDNISAPSVTKIEWWCTICENRWNTSVDSVLNIGSGCPYCAGNMKMTVRDCQERLIVERRNIDVVDLYNGKQNRERRGLFKCGVCNNEWTMILSNLFGKKQGCPSCGKSGRYTQSWFEIYPERKDEPGKLYVLLLEDNNEKFIKIGMTKRTVKSRFNTSVPYEKTQLKEFDTTLYNAFMVEQTVIREFNKHKYLPIKSFGGKNECFSIEIKNKIIEKIKEELQ